MSASQDSRPYLVHVAERHGMFRLRIPELLLSVRGADLQRAYQELLERKQAVIERARANDALDELPTPARQPSFAINWTSSMRRCLDFLACRSRVD
jgi:hypothetical protein